MDMYEAIKSFPKQLEYQPELINGDKLGKYERYIFVGMGGSALAPDLLRVLKPEMDIHIHRDYGLPNLPDKVLRDSLVVLNSYSGNTEEVLDAFRIAREKGLNIAIIATGGELLNLAKENFLPYVQMVNWDLEPRLALGLNIKALLKITGQEDALDKISTIDLKDNEEMGKDIATRLRGSIPVIYSSRRNGPIAYTWKVKINETSKKPAFANVFPELNHNEMGGFDTNKISKLLSQNFYFLFLRDDNDDPRILKRMDVMEIIFKEKKLRVEQIELLGVDTYEKTLASLVLADWVSYYMAKEYGVDPSETFAIEEFKKQI